MWPDIIVKPDMEGWMWFILMRFGTFMSLFRPGNLWISVIMFRNTHPDISPYAGPHEKVHQDDHRYDEQGEVNCISRGSHHSSTGWFCCNWKELFLIWRVGAMVGRWFCVFVGLSRLKTTFYWKITNQIIIKFDHLNNINECQTLILNL